MPDVKIGEKLPGTYCPLCGEMGLRKMVFSGVTWAVCPMVDGEPIVKKLQDAHTAYKLDVTVAPEPGEPARRPATVSTADDEEIDNE